MRVLWARRKRRLLALKRLGLPWGRSPKGHQSWLLSGSSASEEDSVGVEETDVSEDGGAADAAEEVVLLGLDPHAANAVAMVSAITMLKNFFIL